MSAMTPRTSHLPSARFNSGRMMLGDVIEDYSRSLGDPRQISHLIGFSQWLEREFGQPAPLSALTPVLVKAWLVSFVEERNVAAQALWAFRVYAFEPLYDGQAYGGQA
jgi:hypothetical protein